MPSFDIVSEVDAHELSNAVDQANREIGSRFDFKDSNGKYTLEKEHILLSAASDFHIKQMQDVLYGKLAKRDLDPRSLKWEDIEKNLSEARQKATICQGIGKEEAKKLTKLIKELCPKVQASIQGDQVRVNGKKRDDLQETMQKLRAAEFEIPLQFNNFRD
jgi:cyclic-di-GMP-binding protein